jgi:hypothetical protein
VSLCQTLTMREWAPALLARCVLRRAARRPYTADQEGSCVRAAAWAQCVSPARHACWPWRVGLACCVPALS